MPGSALPGYVTVKRPEFVGSCIIIILHSTLSVEADHGQFSDFFGVAKLLGQVSHSREANDFPGKRGAFSQGAPDGWTDPLVLSLRLRPVPSA